MFRSGIRSGLFVLVSLLLVERVGALCAIAGFGQQAGSAESAHEHGSTTPHEGGKVILLPRDLEMRLAINALPKTLRDGAQVVVLDANGYSVAKVGTNAFTCMVSRRSGNLYPVCFDAEGARTILPAYEDDAVLRMKGATNEEVERQLARGFADGKYRPPSRPGIAYMLSPATYLLDEKGKLARTFPHTMFYAPYLTNEDIGGSMGKTAFVDRPGPHGMIIVLAGEKERATLLRESQTLVDEVEAAIGLK
jgi:hypothetical protein